MKKINFLLLVILVILMKEFHFSVGALADDPKFLLWNHENEIKVWDTEKENFIEEKTEESGKFTSGD